MSSLLWSRRFTPFKSFNKLHLPLHTSFTASVQRFRFTNYKQQRSQWYNYYAKFMSISSIAMVMAATTVGKARLDGVDSGHYVDDDFFKKRKDPSKPTIKILVVDGGGLRGCMAIQILQKLEEEIKKQPGGQNLSIHDCFDMIVGTSTGGLIALGFGKLQWSCSQIDDMYDEVAERVFGKDISWTKSVSKKFWSAVSATGLSTALDTSELESVFQQYFKDLKMIRKSNIEPFVSVMSVLSNNYFLSMPVLLKNYDLTGNGFNEFIEESDFHLPSMSDVKVWEAARATSAAPMYFEPMYIPMPQQLKHTIIERYLCDIMGLNFNSITNEQQIIVNEIINGIHNREHTNKLMRLVNDNRNVDIKQSEISIDEFKWIYNEDYRLKFTDGGVHSNAPCLFTFAEAYRIWPDCDFKMLAIGTGKPFTKDIYKMLNTPTIYLNAVFEQMFRGKEMTTMFPLLSYAESDINLDLQRMNPEIDPNETDMADSSLMPLWRKTGQDYARFKGKDLKRWAEFLVKHHNEREQIVEMFHKQSQ